MPGFSEEYEELVREQARMKAEFCLRVGIAPSEYDNLTLIEIEAFIKEANDQARKNSR